MLSYAFTKHNLIKKFVFSPYSQKFRLSSYIVTFALQCTRIQINIYYISKLHQIKSFHSLQPVKI